MQKDIEFLVPILLALAHFTSAIPAPVLRRADLLLSTGTPIDPKNFEISSALATIAAVSFDKRDPAPTPPPDSYAPTVVVTVPDDPTPAPAPPVEPLSSVIPLLVSAGIIPFGSDGSTIYTAPGDVLPEVKKRAHMPTPPPGGYAGTGVETISDVPTVPFETPVAATPAVESIIPLLVSAGVIPFGPDGSTAYKKRQNNDKRDPILPPASYLQPDATTIIIPDGSAPSPNPAPAPPAEQPPTLFDDPFNPGGIFGKRAPIPTRARDSYAQLDATFVIPENPAATPAPAPPAQPGPVFADLGSADIFPPALEGLPTKEKRQIDNNNNKRAPAPILLPNSYLQPDATTIFIPEKRQGGSEWASLALETPPPIPTWGGLGPALVTPAATVVGVSEQGSEPEPTFAGVSADDWARR